MAKYTRKVSRKSSRKVRKGSRKQRGGQVVTTTGRKVVKVYVKVPSTGIIDAASIKSSDPLVTVKAGGTKELTLNFAPSLGRLNDINYRGHSASGWVAAAPAKIFMGSVGTMLTAKHATNSSKSIMRSSARNPATATSLKLPLDVATLGNGLRITGLEQGNFATFSTTGNATNGGANILIELTF
jgi:hypothetical protein